VTRRPNTALSAACARRQKEGGGGTGPSCGPAGRRELCRTPPYRPCNNARPQSHQVLLDLHTLSKCRVHTFVEEQQDAER
jgi:hypothetical protein